MPKRIVVCCDGTWNTPDQTGPSGARPTNVAKIAGAVAPTGADGMEQRMFYHRGVGTNRGERLRGGAFGFGLSRTIRDAYRFLVRIFEPGDELFFLGFSRGAYTARSTVGFIHNTGILRREHEDLIGEAYALYRNHADRTKPSTEESRLFRASYSHETKIRFVGVWDTVGALGIPATGLVPVKWINRRWGFHDTKLNKDVQSAFHALAIDEKRRPFAPTIWERPEEEVVGQKREQVWFAGCHSDVGGGAETPELSDVALRWMVERAEKCGLTFTPGAFDSLESGNERDEMPGIHESRTKFYRLIPPYFRPLGVPDTGDQTVDPSAVRWFKIDGGYRPENLAAYLDRDYRTP